MRQSGTVKFYNSQKGYGFIKPDDGGKDVFVHVTAVERAGIGNLDEGTRIFFDTEPDKRGRARKRSICSRPDAQPAPCVPTHGVTGRQRSPSFFCCTRVSDGQRRASAAIFGHCFCDVRGAYR